jgi:hypothetical protein
VTIAMNPTAAVRRVHGAPVDARILARAELRHRRLAATYRRRRAVAGLLLAVVAGTGALAGSTLLTGPGGVPASAAGAGTEADGPPMSVRVEAGDSLWSIAEAHHGTVSIARYLEALIDRNGGTVIEVGQLVRLP